MWDTLTRKIKVNDNVYVVCRSRAIAETYANMNKIPKGKFKYVVSLDELRGLERDITIKVIFLSFDSPHWREEIGRLKIRFSNIEYVRM